MQLLIVYIIVAQFLTYPHFKIMKTQLSSISKRPYDLLKIVNEFVLENSATNDEILTFYLPAVANIDRKTPLVLNEGQGSITILDDNFARKFHLTSRGMLHELISTRRVKLIVFTDTFIYYFGVNDQERQETLKLINQNSLVIDIGSNDGSLLSYFKGYGIKVLGIDPATNLAKIAELKGIDTINDFVSVDLAKKIRRNQGPAKIITATNVV